jgi:CDP-glucose 4,6-dehydratase
MNKSFWKGKRVFITGHTGFKGSWLVMLLKNAGAIVGGFSREVPTSPSVFDSCHLHDMLEVDDRGDVADYEVLKRSLHAFKPEFLFHLAAQPLVRYSYQDPFDTYKTNVMGTLNVLMAADQCTDLSVIINVTTDKCYENKEWQWPYREIDPLGGYDPYSSSKACAEILSASIRNSFFLKSGKRMATVRAGNVIGGGDWASDRIIPDFMRAFQETRQIPIRNPHAIRPWQHVLEPLSGYLLLAEKMSGDESLSGPWNFGPDEKDCKTVEFIVTSLCDLIPDHKGVDYVGNNQQPHEANFLKLDCSKAKTTLKWKPKLDVQKALETTAAWYRCQFSGGDLRSKTLEQINEYLAI